jgi:hypothetical protein
MFRCKETSLEVRDTAGLNGRSVYIYYSAAVPKIALSRYDGTWPSTYSEKSFGFQNSSEAL